MAQTVFPAMVPIESFPSCPGIVETCLLYTSTSRHSITQPERLETAIQEHRAILNSIVAGDKELAKDTIQKHIRKTQTLVRAYYANKKKKNNKVND